MKALLVAIYGIGEGVVYGLLLCKGLVDCVKIIKTCPILLVNYPCSIVKVYVYGWFQFNVDSDPELGRHCSNVDYFCKGFLIKENFKR